MRDFLRFERRELLVFGLCALLYVAIWLVWTVLPLVDGQSIADINSPFGGVPLIGELPQQSISKLIRSDDFVRKQSCGMDLSLNAKFSDV